MSYYNRGSVYIVEMYSDARRDWMIVGVAADKETAKDVEETTCNGRGRIGPPRHVWSLTPTGKDKRYLSPDRGIDIIGSLMPYIEAGDIDTIEEKLDALRKIFHSLKPLVREEME